jgi:OmpA-OmpF porin, OOP family
MRLPSTRGSFVGWLSAVSFAFGLLALAAPQARAAGAGDFDAPDEEDDGPTEYRFEFGLGGGYHFFDSESGLGRFTDDPPEWSPKDNFALGGHLALNFNRWVSVEGQALWIPTRSVLDPGGTVINVFAYRGSLVVHLVGSGPFRPFLLAGYGAMSSVTNDSNIVPSDTDGTLHGGGGFKIGGERIGVRLEGRVLAPPAFLGTRLPVGDEIGFHGPDYEALGSLYLNFGEVEKVKKIIVKETTKEVVVKPQAAKNPDPDGDGIANTADKCPNVAEDKDGFEDDDGCVDNDNDGDNIPDAQDKCPNKPETMNAVDDDDGCPEVDSDGDGFLGSRDKCPDEPETRNGFKDDDGCPDEIPQAVKKFTGVIEGINFRTGRATIMGGSYALLDRAVAVLKEYPDVRLEISGHTDSRGKADSNRDLSQRRADAVKMYFITNGIAPDRLTSIGYGADRPIADNATDSGRSRNRRTEFRLLTTEEGKSSGTPAAPPTK